MVFGIGGGGNKNKEPTAAAPAAAAADAEAPAGASESNAVVVVAAPPLPPAPKRSAVALAPVTVGYSGDLTFGVRAEGYRKREGESESDHHRRLDEEESAVDLADFECLLRRRFFFSSFSTPTTSLTPKGEFGEIRPPPVAVPPTCPLSFVHQRSQKNPEKP